MARPQTLRSDRGLVETRLRHTTDLRFDALKAFVKLLKGDDVLEDVQRDDALFASIIYLSIHEYGLPQAHLARELGASPAAVGRWASLGEPLPKGTKLGEPLPEGARPSDADTKGSLPPVYGRKTIVEQIAHLLSESIAEQVERPLRFHRGFYHREAS